MLTITKLIDSYSQGIFTLLFATVLIQMNQNINSLVSSYCPMGGL